MYAHKRAHRKLTRAPGWIVKIKMADAKQLESLMDAAAYKNHLANADH
jgi:glycine cleavage system H lipoate-binding protein